MSEIKGKKLLVLGGTNLSCDVIDKARTMGIYTIVSNYDPDSPAKRLADKSFMVSTIDYRNLIELCKQEGVDGVFTASDLSLPYAQRICCDLGMPFLCSSEQLELISNKRKAKHLCIRHDIPVPEEFNLKSILRNEDLRSIEYPVLAKPVDSSGQKGISICRNENELRAGYMKALESSPSRGVVVEKYLSGDYVVMCFTIQNGYLSLSAMADKIVIDEGNSHGMVRLPNAYVMPSKYIDLFYTKYYEKFCELIEEVGLRNGSFGVEALVQNQSLFVFEMQCRLGGMKHEEFVLRENSIDLLEMHVKYAVSGEFSGYDVKKHDNPKFGKVYCLLNLLLLPGTIHMIKGVEYIKKMPGVINFWTLCEIGDVIEFTGTLRQIFAKIAIEASSRTELIKIVENIRAEIEVYDDKGLSMILKDSWTY